MYDAALQGLVDELNQLPGIGPKSAARIAFHLLAAEQDDVTRLVSAITDVKTRVRFCDTCGNVAEGPLCAICIDARRVDSVICVVEEAKDVVALERTREFRGRYHVLGGTLSPLDGVGPDDLTIPMLIDRARSGEVKEVLLALNATVEGQSTAHYLTDQLAGCNVSVSRLAYGVPIGGELDYLDEGTLAAAVKARKAM